MNIKSHMRESTEEFFFPILWPIRKVYPKLRTWKLRYQVAFSLVLFVAMFSGSYVVAHVFAELTGLK